MKKTAKVFLIILGIIIAAALVFLLYPSSNNNNNNDNLGCNDRKIVLEGKFAKIQDKYTIDIFNTSKGDYWIYGEMPNYDEANNNNVKIEAVLSPARPSECNICYRTCDSCQCPSKDLIYNVKIVR